MFALVILLVLQATAQNMNWSLVNTGTNKNIRDISFINKDTGFIAGDNGLLKITTNGGTTWADMTIPATGQGVGNNNNIKVAQFYNYGGFIAGILFYDKFIAINRTYDLSGGWTEECGGPPFFSIDSICSINNFHHNQSYAEYTAGGNCLEGGGYVGFFGGFCFTFDSLRSDTSFNGWADVTSNVNDVAIMVGPEGYYAVCPAYASPFTLMNSGSGFDYLTVDWSDTSTVYAVNNSGFWLLEKSINGGASFVIDSSIGPTFYYPDIEEMDFTDNDWGVMGGSSNGSAGIIVTKRGDLIDFFLTDTALTSVFVIDSTIAFAGGLNGELYKYDQSLGIGIEPIIENINFSISPNPQNVENDILNLFVEEVINEIVVYDMLGKVLLSQKINRQGQISLNTGIKNTGTYVVRIFTDEGVGTRKYVVN